MNKTNNSKLDDKGTLWMWTSVQMERTWRVKEYWWNYYCSDYDDVHVNKYKVKCGTSLKFWENKGWINSIDPYIWFQRCFKYWIDRRYLDDKRQISRWKRIVSRFKSKLVKMIKDLMIISLKTGEILLHWGYGLVESDFFYLFYYQNRFFFLNNFMTKNFFVSIKMSYHQFKRKELWQKAKYEYHNCCGNEKATQYYIQNKEVPKKWKKQV